MKIKLTLLFTFWISFCIAQQVTVDTLKQNRIIINLGYNQFKDENLHSKVFRGLKLGSAYTRTRKRENISEYTTGFDISLLNTTYEEFPSALSILLQANYKYLFSVFS